MLIKSENEFFLNKEREIKFVISMERAFAKIQEIFCIIKLDQKRFRICFSIFLLMSDDVIYFFTSTLRRYRGIKALLFGEKR